jgi:hypothetical protein
VPGVGRAECRSRRSCITTLLRLRTYVARLHKGAKGQYWHFPHTTLLRLRTPSKPWQWPMPSWIGLSLVCSLASLSFPQHSSLSQGGPCDRVESVSHHLRSTQQLMLCQHTHRTDTPELQLHNTVALLNHKHLHTDCGWKSLKRVLAQPKLL